MAITAQQVKELRDATGISMMKCKQALEEANGDLEAARDILRKAGEKDAAKKSDRETGEGAIFMAKEDGKAAVIQIRCETDFVARDENFSTAGNTLAATAFADGEDAARAAAEEVLQGAIQKLGENIQLGEVRVVEAAIIGSYIHSNNKIGVLVMLASGSEDIAKQVAMHTAAMSPSYLTPDEVTDEEIERERGIQLEILKNEGKPEEMIEKIMEGKLKKFREESALVKQPFAMDSSKTVEQFLSENGAEISGFVRLAI